MEDKRQVFSLKVKLSKRFTPPGLIMPLKPSEVLTAVITPEDRPSAYRLPSPHQMRIFAPRQQSRFSLT